MRNGVAGRRVAVINSSTPSTELQLQLANKAHSHRPGNFALGEGSGSRKSESVTALTRDLLVGIKNSSAVSPARTGTCSNTEVVFQAVMKSSHLSWVNQSLIWNYWTEAQVIADHSWDCVNAAYQLANCQ